LTLLFGVLAMASKSSTVILPVVLCLCAWWMEGRWQWRNLLRVFPFFLMTLAVSAVSIWAVDSHKFSDPRSMPQRIVAAGDAVWFYLGKLLWPHPLIAIYPRWQIDAGRWISYLPLLAVIIVLVILWLKRESRLRPCFFVFAFFLTALLPVLGLVGTPIYQYSLVFDHFQYLPSMGPLSLMGAGMAWLADFVIPKKTWLQSSFCAGLLLILGLLSWQRACAYESEETLWSDTLAKNPNCWLAYNNLGNAFLQKGQMDDAMAQFQEAIKINPGYDASRVNLGNALVKKGQVDDAIAQYQQVLESNPDYAAARDSLGTALFQKGQVDDAVTQYQKALEINPNNAIVHYNLGDAFAQQGKISEAIAQFQTALEINPNYAAARNNLEKAEAITRQSAAQDK
jgi:tetratricopeptide (TPR) repeat protein